MEEVNRNRSFLGTGWAFPPAFHKPAATGTGNGHIETVSEQEDIEQSLKILLATRPGERIMHPGFGCNLDRLLFEPLDTSLKAYMEDIVKTAILYHEPRIRTESVSITEDTQEPGKLYIIVAYTIRTTNSRYNYVHPFDKTEFAGTP